MSTWARAMLVACCAIALASLLTGLVGPTTHHHLEANAAADDDRPNVVLITTDDQTLRDMAWMPRTRRLLGHRGMTFTDALSPHPNCCPARAEIVTGQYAQNNGVLHNTGAHGGFEAFADNADTLAAWLQDSGYLTAQVGKYMNDYRSSSGRQAGWTHWDASVKGVYSYFRTTTYDDGAQTLRDDYIADVIGQQTSRWVEEFSSAERPFFIWASHLPPHAGRTPERADGLAWPAGRHLDALLSVRAPQLSAASFNRVDAVDQPVYDDPHIGRLKPTWVQKAFTARIQSLQAVDQMVSRLVRQLRSRGELADTYILFTSDNGFLLGEHQVLGKNVLYQEALDVPMLVRGPGVRAGQRSDVPVTLTDLAPTITDIADVTPGRTPDGASFLPALLGEPLEWRDTQLVQTGSELTSGPNPGWEWRGVTTTRYTYGVNARTGQRQLYDRRRDPSELRNVAGDPRYAAVVHELRRRTVALEGCSGKECRMSFGPVGKPLPGVT